MKVNGSGSHRRRWTQTFFTDLESPEPEDSNEGSLDLGTAGHKNPQVFLCLKIGTFWWLDKF